MSDASSGKGPGTIKSIIELFDSCSAEFDFKKKKKKAGWGVGGGGGGVVICASVCERWCDGCKSRWYNAYAGERR